MTPARLRYLAVWCLLIIATAAMVPVGCSVWINTDPEGVVWGGGGVGGVAGGGGVGGGVGGGGGAGGVYTQADFAGPQEFTEAEEFDYSPFPFPPEGAKQVTLGLDFTWVDRAARPAAFDLSAHLSGVSAPLVQIFSVRDRAFVRAGTHLEPIDAGVSYRLEVTRTSAAVWVTVVQVDDGAVVLSGPVEELSSPSDDTLTLITVKQDPRVRLGPVRAWRSGP